MPHVDRHERQAVVLDQDPLEPVGELVLLERDLRDVLGVCGEADDEAKEECSEFHSGLLDRVAHSRIGPCPAFIPSRRSWAPASKGSTFRGRRTRRPSPPWRRRCTTLDSSSFRANRSPPPSSSPSAGFVARPSRTCSTPSTT